MHRFATRWETWLGAAAGGAIAAGLTFVLLRPIGPHAEKPGITLALHEAREVDVLIDSERNLEGATIRIAVTGGVALDGFEDEHQIRWQTTLERGSNLLSLPLVGRSAGAGQLIATIEHEGRTRQVIVNLNVLGSKAAST